MWITQVCCDVYFEHILPKPFHNLPPILQNMVCKNLQKTSIKISALIDPQIKDSDSTNVFTLPPYCKQFLT